ncbi:cytochrome c [Nitrosomonas sp. JL21]|uniref:c-type cytochrome n=1 Tax=Nitrosomonas sp. JL21 TaxID=153949 RepID=UPI001371D496|nr:cytochrome c [Nitrosomonas sp. JL21]MBL8496419.1 cytochrome c [Nitrosomonas sp.]MCC7092146.1 cytochrome c [Nitrosomonas sp.]MXS77310.1 cytochrome c [Nitrosomonas sp. JL21]
MKEIIRNLIVVFGFMPIIIFLATTWVWAAQEDNSASSHRWKDGAEIYTKICAYCHDAQVAPPIRNRKLPLDYIRNIVRNGNRAMPAFRPSEINDESLTKLAEFISHQSSQH